MRKLPVWALALVLSVGCDCGDEEITQGVSPEQNSAFGDMRVHLDLVELAHLADVDHFGTFIDLGTPARLKYTLGQWRTGWVSDETEGTTSFSYAGLNGRLFFHVDEAGPLVLGVNARPHGSRNMTVYLNGDRIDMVTLEEGNSFRDYQVSVPAERVRDGDNYLQLRFGGVESIGGEDVAAAIASVRVFEGSELPAGEYEPVTYDGFVQQVSHPYDGDPVERPALVVPRTTTVRYYVQVPPAATLGFGVASAAAGANLRVRVTEDQQEPAEVFSEAVTTEWNDQALSLEQFAGKIVQVEFDVTGEGAEAVAISTPSLLLPAIEARERPAPVKNVIVLLVDTLRADALQAFNSESNVRTPATDALAAGGTVFQNAMSPENWTKPSVASILTGLYPATHQVKESESRLPASALMISEHLSANGFATGTFLANGYVSEKFGFEQGWDHYTNYIRENKSTEAENVFAEAGDWIEAHKDERFFTYIQTIDPHVPYDPPEEYLAMYDRRDYSGPVAPRRTADILEEMKRDEIELNGGDRRRLRALHDGEISYHDHFLGVFVERLKELGVWEDTIFVLTSDHGEEFNDHGSWGHGHSLFHELIHVPLMFHHAGAVPAGNRVEEVVSTVDIISTVLTATHVDAMPQDEGRNLMGFMHGVAPPGPTVAFSDHMNDRRAITAGRYKLMLNGINGTLYDLENDPGEDNEVARADHPIGMRFCRIYLGQWLGAQDRGNWLSANQDQSARLEAEAAEMDPTTLEQLRALGYAN